ncbi:rho GTPase-activating protein 20-like isoform X2 [Cotesia glomerata]|uniref:rho GTPase-activating protein 20-like isoform X2 n=1 Tax=Cotesia glomerata TaxID=32391 RepID=UPI001D01DD1D|nr:rho GTPase-activating protein 20-like isoform X2 [Cotesia glomerata]
MMTMFGTLVQRLTSPVTSPTSSRRRLKSPSRWEIQSDPEDDCTSVPTIRKSRAKHLLDKRKSKSRARGLNVGEPMICTNTQNVAGWCDVNSIAGGFPLRGTKSLGRLDGFKEVQRLAEYERYLGQEARTLIETNSTNNKSKNKNNNNISSGVVFQRAQLEGDLHRIQELFPGDNLRLHERDVLTTKMKSLIRKRNGGNPGRLTRALSQKNLQNICSSPAPNPTTKSPPRKFFLETPVQFTTGMQSQDRHLFLFSDLLLIAKARSGGNFKLKQTVKMSELWLTKEHIEDVSESNKSQETSFVLGWPTTNVVATFMTAAARDLWWGRLTELVREENLNEPPNTNIQVVYHDNDTNTEYCKTIMVSSEMTAGTCVHLATRLLDLQGNFQLWARTSIDEAPYPLIGHERPFAIKLSNLRHTLSTEEGFDLEHCNKSGHDTCHFILRPIIKSPIKKNNKSKITGILRRSLSLNPNIFGVNLSRLDDNGLPKPVLVMLQQLFSKGPFTQGIFRKSANVRIVRELRDQIESTGDTNCLEDAPIIAVASLLKDFLRSLPDPLLTFHLFPLWMASLESKNPVQTIKSIIDRLPKENYTLLSHLVCVLHHIARRSKQNLMCASNLGVCCGPSLLWSSNPTVNQSRAIPTLTEMLIRHCEILFGDGVTLLFGEERSDSGAEESTDSLHCGLSLDSLDLTEPPRKDHMSLSRDSGLTLSDCQLFIPESPVGSEDSVVNVSNSSYEKSSSSSSSTSTDKDKFQINKSSYIRIYTGWEDRLNSYTTNITTTTTSSSNNIVSAAAAAAAATNHNQTFCDEKLNYPNPNFQRQDWLRAQLKRNSRTKLEDDQRKERFDDKDIFTRDYLRQTSIKENVDNCKDISVFRAQQHNVNSCLNSNTPNFNHDSSEKNSNGDSTIILSEQRSQSYNFKKERFDFKKLKGDYEKLPTVSSQNGSYHSNADLYEYKKVLTKHDIRLENNNKNNSNSNNNNIYGNRETITEIYSSREIKDMYKLKQSETINNFCDDHPAATATAVVDDDDNDNNDEDDDDDDNDDDDDDDDGDDDNDDDNDNDDDDDDDDDDNNDIRTWPDTPPPLPPRLRHLPPVHMSLEDRHKVAGRSRSLPPPPPYRPPPQPRAPITTRHLGYPRSIIDDESYV